MLTLMETEARASQPETRRETAAPSPAKAKTDFSTIMKSQMPEAEPTEEIETGITGDPDAVEGVGDAQDPSQDTAAPADLPGPPSPSATSEPAGPVNNNLSAPPPATRDGSAPPNVSLRVSPENETAPPELAVTTDLRPSLRAGGTSGARAAPGGPALSAPQHAGAPHSAPPRTPAQTLIGSGARSLASSDTLPHAGTGAPVVTTLAGGMAAADGPRPAPSDANAPNIASTPRPLGTEATIGAAPMPVQGRPDSRLRATDAHPVPLPDRAHGLKTDIGHAAPATRSGAEPTAAQRMPAFAAAAQYLPFTTHPDENLRIQLSTVLEANAETHTESNLESQTGRPGQGVSTFAGAGALFGPRSAIPYPPTLQVAAAIARASADGSRTIELRLNPEELGSVRLRLDAGADRFMVSVFAERGETLELMRRNIDLLTQQLHEIGYDDAQFFFSQGGSGTNGEPESGPSSTSALSGDLPDNSQILPPVSIPLGDRLDIRL